MRSFIYYVRKIFRKTNIINTLIHTRTCAYQWVRNVSLSENFANVTNEWSLLNDQMWETNVLTTDKYKRRPKEYDISRSLFHFIFRKCVYRRSQSFSILMKNYNFLLFGNSFNLISFNEMQIIAEILQFCAKYILELFVLNLLLMITEVGGLVHFVMGIQLKLWE